VTFDEDRDERADACVVEEFGRFVHPRLDHHS
jgi:hypothetical protein